MVSKKVSTGFPEARGVGYILVRRTGLCDPEVGAGVGRRLFTSPLTITRRPAGGLQGDCRALGLGLGQAKEGQERRQEFGDDVIGRILPMLQVYPEKAHRRDEGAEAGWL